MLTPPRRRLVLLGIFVLGICGLLASLGLTATLTDEVYAEEMVSICKDSPTISERELCYQKHVPKIMDEGVTMERAFRITQLILDNDPQYQSCHVLAHLLTAKEVGKDPSKWKDVVMRSPTGFCGTGALHGAFQERFRIESMPDADVDTLRGMLEGVCDPRDSWHPTLLDRSSCVHGMGHLFLYVTDADVKKSVELCGALAKLSDFDFRQTCYEGVFMQANQPLEAEDEILIRNIASSTKNPQKFCAQFEYGLVRDTCLKESWAQDSKTVTTAEGFERLCKQTSPEYVPYCASANIFATIETLHYDLPKIKDLCRSMKDQLFKDSCWARTAVKYIWADERNVHKAVAVCEDAPAESKDMCWKSLTEYAQQGWQKGYAVSKQLCESMPEPYGSACTTATAL